MTPTIAAIIWAIGVLVWAAIRMPRRRVAKRTAVVIDKKSNAERIALGLCILGLAILPIIYLATDVLDFANHSYSSWMGWIGAIIMIDFLVLFYICHKEIGKNWSVTLEVREDHELIQSGIYHYVRHPMYTSFWLWGLAQALLLPNWIAGFAGLAAVAWLYFSRVDKEEEMMREQFGAEYDAYCTRTGRIFPRLL